MKKNIFLILVIFVLSVGLVNSANIDLNNYWDNPYSLDGLGHCTGDNLAPNGECWTGLDFDKDGYDDTIIVCRSGDERCPKNPEDLYTPYDWGELIKITLSKGDPIASGDGDWGEDGIFFQPLDTNGNPIGSLISALTNVFNYRTPVYSLLDDGITPEYEAFPDSPNEILAYVEVLNTANTLDGPARFRIDALRLYATDYNPNSAPVINSQTLITGDVRASQVQSFQIIVEDAEDDSLTYEWYVDDELVSTQEEYNFDGGVHESGEHTIEVIVNDGQYNDTTSWVVDVRAKGGAPSNLITGMAVTDIQEEVVVEIVQIDTSRRSIPLENTFFNIVDWFKGLFK